MAPDTDEQRLRVLLVDDSPDMRALLRTLLADRTNVEVAGEADDGEKAVALAATLLPDLIILDIAMPVLDGVAALPRLRRVSPGSRIVVLSALPAPRHAPAALGAGAAAYVHKAVSTDSLIDDLLAGAGLLDVAVRTLGGQARESFPADPRSVSASRRFVEAALDGWAQVDLADTITLLLSELVTNAILHANTAPDVTVRLLPDRVHVEVTDTQGGALRPKPPDDNATGGRGLALVESLSMAWGSVDLPGGKVVWFDVERATTDAHSA